MFKVLGCIWLMLRKKIIMFVSFDKVGFFFRNILYILMFIICGGNFGNLDSKIFL